MVTRRRAGLALQAYRGQKEKVGGERSSQGPRAKQLLRELVQEPLTSAPTLQNPCPPRPPSTHSQPLKRPSVWGLTKRLFSKTLSLESESKSLQEVKGRRSIEEVTGAGVWSLEGTEVTSSQPAWASAGLGEGSVDGQQGN